MILVWLAGVVDVILLLAVMVWLYIIRQGDAKFEFLVSQRSKLVLTELTNGSAEFTCKIPFVNKGTQDGTIMDAFPRSQLPCEQYDAAEVLPKLTLESIPRDDGYWEAVIIHKGTGDAVLLTVKLQAKNGNIQSALQEMVDLPVDILYQVVARTPWYIHKTRVEMTGEEIRQAFAAGIAAE